MNLTKKQTAAIQRIIDNCASMHGREDTAGEAPVSDGIIITDGYVLLHAPESLGFKQQNKPDQKNAEKMNGYVHAAHDEFGGGDFYRVEESFPMEKLASTLRDKLKERMFKSDDGQKNIVELSAKNTRGDEIWSAFVVENVINAFEAVGKDAVGYIGNSSGVPCPMPYLIVEPAYDYGNFSNSIHAMVMPARVSRRHT